MGPRAEQAAAYLGAWRSVIDGRAAYDELILWFEHDLFDRLNLIHVLDRLGPAAVGPGSTAISLICIGAFPGRPDFKGLGQLNPDELAWLLETRQPVETPNRSRGARIEGVRTLEPREDETLLGGDTSARPSWPRRCAGTSRSTRGRSRPLPARHRILELAARQSAPSPPQVCLRRRDRLYIGDGSYWKLVEGLAAAALVTLTVEPAPGPASARIMSLTETGRAIVDGERTA